MVQGLLGDFISTQRRIIIEERRFQKDEKRTQDLKTKISEEAKLNFYKDQLSLLKEKYQETLKEEEIVSKAQKEEMRKIIKEEKELAKKKISIAKVFTIQRCSFHYVLGKTCC